MEKLPGNYGKGQNQRANLAFKTLVHLQSLTLDLLTALSYAELPGHSMLFLVSAIWHLLLILYFLRCPLLQFIHLASSYSFIKTSKKLMDT